MYAKSFLTAEWENLVMANYIVNESLLKAYIPAKTELDRWNNQCYISLVGFMFRKVRVKGIQIPFHVNFPEVNLRFYVRYKQDSEWKRGVVFIKEIVPRRAISIVANTLFNERYITLPMKYKWEKDETGSLSIGYYWKKQGRWNSIAVQADALALPMVNDSEEEFITEHFWGYSFINNTATGEYHVQHPRWNIHPVNKYTIDCDFETVYGKEFSSLLTQSPASVFLAEGSRVSVFAKKTLNN